MTLRRVLRQQMMIQARRDQCAVRYVYLLLFDVMRRQQHRYVLLQVLA